MRKNAILAMLLIFCFAALFAGTASADAAMDWYSSNRVSYDVEVTDPDGYVNIRSGPGTGYDILTTAATGTILHVDAESYSSYGNLWCQVYCNGYYGWVALERVTVLSSENAAENMSAAVDYNVKVTDPDGYVNIRSGPGTEYSILTTAATGTILHVNAESYSSYGNLWCQVYCDGYYGWLALERVTVMETKTTDSDPTEIPVATPTETPIETPTVESESKVYDVGAATDYEVKVSPEEVIVTEEPISPQLTPVPDTEKDDQKEINPVIIILLCVILILFFVIYRLIRKQKR